MYVGMGTPSPEHDDLLWLCGRSISCFHTHARNEMTPTGKQKCTSIMFAKCALLDVVWLLCLVCVCGCPCGEIEMGKVKRSMRRKAGGEIFKIDD